MFSKIIYKLAYKFLSFSDISTLYQERKFQYDREKHKESLIIKDHAEKEILEFLKQQGANFQRELEKQDFIGIKLSDNNVTIPHISFWSLRGRLTNMENGIDRLERCMNELNKKD